VPRGDDRRAHRQSPGHRLPRRRGQPARSHRRRRSLHRASRSAAAGADVAPRDLRHTPAARRRAVTRRHRELAAPRDGIPLRRLMALLEIRGLIKRFLGVTAVDRVDLAVERGELVSLIGPNGSGKTTLFNCVTGYVAADGGQVLFRGRDLSNAPPHRVARLGVGRTFQQVSVFPRLSALDNLLVFLQQHQEERVLARLLRTPRVRRLEAAAVERARRLLDLVGLGGKAEAAAGSLSYGQRKLLAFAGALMPDPELLLLDEPAAAVNPTMINQMKEHIRALHRQGKTVLLVEHNMDVVMDISQRVVVLDHGQKIAEGPPEAIRRDPRVIEAYFGR